MKTLNRRRFIYLIFLFLFVFVFKLPLLAAFEVDSLNNKVIKDLSEEWLIYDKQYNGYIAYLGPENNSGIRAINQWTDLEQFKNYNINFIAYPGLSFFVNERLYYKNTSNEIKRVSIPVENLSTKKYQRELITLFNPRGELPFGSFFIGFNSNLKSEINHGTEIIHRRVVYNDNIYILLFLLILFFLAILKNRYPKRFAEFYSFNFLFPQPTTEENWNVKSFSTPALLLVLINSLSFCLIISMIRNIRVENSALGQIFGNASLFNLIFIFVLIFLLKFMYLKVMGWVFNLSDVVKSQYFEFVKVFLNINLILVPLLIILYKTHLFLYIVEKHIWIYLLLSSIVIILIHNTFLIFKLSNFRNLYLFSYLCTTEILPIVIMIKFFSL